MERTAEDLNESVEKETQAMTEKAESLLEEAMEDMELPEMER